MSDFFHPRLEAVEALAPWRLGTRWSTGEVLEVDVEGVLRATPALAALLDPAVFARVHLAEGGQGIEWFDEEFGADNVYAWAQEQAGAVSHQMFDEWMHRNALSLSTAAEALGISRRMVSYYRTAHKAIPRAIWLPAWAGRPPAPRPAACPAACRRHWNTRRCTAEGVATPHAPADSRRNPPPRPAYNKRLSKHQAPP